MATRCSTLPLARSPRPGHLARTLLAAALASGLGLLADGGRAGDDGEPGPRRRYCSATAEALYQACRSEVRDDLFVAQARCLNVSDLEEAGECRSDAREALAEGRELCRAQRAGRLAACKSLGQDRYDPDLDPALFDDPRSPSRPNPYFPLDVGNRWQYAGGQETNTVEVLDETKAIAGLDCIVFRDQVFEKGDLKEDTDDWYVPARDGAVWYCGEEAKDYESTEGDDPRLPELVSIDGSFKAGRDGDKPGIIFLADPRPGDVYLEEFSLGNAEDVTEVLSTTYAFGQDAELDRMVPRALAERLCAGDCVVTRNFSLLEPGVFELKYHARGIGVFLEVEPGEGVVVQLTDCNFDARCENLPQP
jgi:hypothetical protein